MTISTSRAPLSTASPASATLEAVLEAPSGNPATLQTATPSGPSSRKAVGTQYELTHTLAKPKRRASSQSFTIWLCVASGRKRV